MNEKRLKEVTVKVEELKTLEGKEFVRSVIRVVKDDKLTSILAAERKFRWLFDKIDTVAKTVPKETLETWRKEIYAEVEEGK